MLRWKQLGENTVCSDKTDSGDVHSGKKNSMANADDCPKLCLTKPNCAFANYWAQYKYCYLFSAGACSKPKDDKKYKGISWKRHTAGTTTTAAATTTTTAAATTAATSIATTNNTASTAKALRGIKRLHNVQ